MNRLQVHKEEYKIAVMLILLAIAVILTYYFHFVLRQGIIFTHFFYIPIILAAIWWKRKGLVVPLFLSCMLILSDFLSGRLGFSLTEDLFRVFMFMAISTVITVLSEQISITEKRLSESEEKFRSVAQSAVDGIITTDANGNIVLFNESLLNIFGFDKNEIEGKPVTMLMPQRYWKIFEESLVQFQKTGLHGHAGETFETTGLRKDGSEFPFEISLATWSSKGKLFTTSIIRNITERKQMEEELEKSLQEKEMLLKEIYHRVKNNLMVISSLLNLQARYIKDKEALGIFRESQNRAKSMALIHERLYRSDDLKRINFGEYIRTLAADLFHTYAADPSLIKLSINVEDVMLDINTAIPLGLVVNELISNSLKHGFPEGREGKINIDFHSEDATLILTVFDNGVGFPTDLDFRNTESLGLRLVNSLTEQIDGKIELDRSQGTEFKITFEELKLE